MGKDNFYGRLGVNKNASQEEIKEAYRKIAKEKHPDRFVDSEKKKKAEDEFKLISEAYNILSNPRKRAEYDNPRPNQMGFGGFNGAVNFHFVNHAPLEIAIEISVEQAFSGTQKMIHYKRSAMCENCDGTGSGKDHFVSKCRFCRGTGKAHILGNITPYLCTQCGGTGQTVRYGCRQCNSMGTRLEDCKVRLNIPAGCTHRNVISLRGAGNFQGGMLGNAYGDLFVRIMVADDDIYKVEFPDLVVEVPVTYATALLGGSVIAPSPHGDVRVTVPPRSPHGTRLRIGGKGLKAAVNSSVYGNLMVVIAIDMPVVFEGGNDIVRSLDGDLFDHEGVRAYRLKMDQNSSSD